MPVRDAKSGDLHRWVGVGVEVAVTWASVQAVAITVQ